MLLAALVTAATLAADLQQIAKLPGEPSVVAAAGITPDEQAVLTIEDTHALDAPSATYRAVIFGTSDAAAAAVVEMVRWFKTSAPADVKQRWTITALPASHLIDERSKSRWVTFQAPDIAIEVDDADAHPAGTGGVAEQDWVLRLPVNPEALGRNLRSARPVRSAVRAQIASRVARDPIAIAKLLATKYPGTPSISYIPSIAWANTLALAPIAGDASLRTKVEQQTAPWRTEGKDLFGERIQLTSVAGTFVFGELGAADVVAKGVEAASRVKAGDVYEYGQGWTDDMFMATVVLARGGKVDLASRMLVAYASRLQRPDGVFVHAPNGPVAWGRGNGFAALGLTEALTAITATDPNRAPLLDLYRRQMAAAVKLQAPDGMWNEVLDEPGSYREESATAMLMTAMSRGVRAGWLDRSFVPPIERAWRGIAAHVADDGTIVDVCTSTGSGPTKRYYLDRAAVTGADDRGGAMALMAAMEMNALRHAPAVAAQ
jgi:hypothetical protein